jgi:hypothetical protein
MASPSSSRLPLLLIASVVVAGLVCFFALRSPAGRLPTAPAPAAPATPPATAPVYAPASGNFNPDYPKWTPLERSTYLAGASAMNGAVRTEFLKSAYRVELDAFMRVEILSYFEEGDLEPAQTELLSLLVQTEPDPMVREAILMTASTHGKLGQPILNKGLQDGEDDVRVLARELLDEMAEGN